MAIVLGVLMMAAPSAAILPDDILANINAGRSLCSNPDPATKTCTTIATYAPSDTGTFSENAEILINESPPIIFATKTLVRLEDGAICGTVEEATISNGKVRYNGVLLPADRNAAVVARLAENFATMFGKKTCDRISLVDGKLLKFGQVERVDIKLPGKPVQWISPGDGYKVAPRVSSASPSLHERSDVQQ